MAVMIVLMVVLLVMGGHHGMTGSHDAKPPAAEVPQHKQGGDAAKPEEEKR